MRLIGYQVPLKARRIDAIGKIDLLGLLDDGRVCVIELKAPDGCGDSPFRALIEGLSYAAVLEANRAAFNEEVLARYPDAADKTPLVVVVLGPTSWWQAWEHSKPAGSWKHPFNALCTALQARLGVTIACVALDGYDRSRLTLGLNRQAPKLPSIPALVDVARLPTLRGTDTRERAANSYLRMLIATMRTYAATNFNASMFEGPSGPRRPPVFRPAHAYCNVIAAPDDELTEEIVSMLPTSARHKHFASMRSSQALTQSVFGALAATGQLGALGDVTAECGRSAFAKNLEAHIMTFEKQVSWLAEPRPTAVDVWFEARRR